MITYPTPVSSTPALTDEETLNAAVGWVSPQIPLATQGMYSPQTFYHVLLWGAIRQDTVEHACQVLTDVPSSNDVRYHLNQFEAMAELEAQANKAIQGRLPDSIRNHRHCLAIDFRTMGCQTSRKPRIFTALKQKRARPPFLPMPPSM